MKNYEIHHYRSQPLCDMHIHLHMPATLAETEAVFRNVTEYCHYDRIALEALPSHDITDNFKALYLKSRMHGVYANLGLIHHFDERDTQEYYLDQVKTYYAMGCDGIKMLEGKPDYRKQFNRPLDDSSLDLFYGFCEEKGLPIVMHFGDPREFWDRERIPKWALERGWLYDESFTPFEKGQKEVEGILSKFPKLRLTLAHFFFVSDDYDYACRFMEKWENVCFDLTPGTEMYFNFDANAERWRDFFLKYSHRILYGTDIYNWQQGNETMEQTYAHAVNLERSFLERKEPFFDPWTGRELRHPFGFDDAVLDDLYYQNFVRVFGVTPRALDPALIRQECSAFLESTPLNAQQTENLKEIIRTL